MICGIGLSSSISAALVWSRVRLEEVGRFVAWLRLPAAGRVGNVCGAADGGERVLGGDGEPQAVGDLGVL